MRFSGVLTLLGAAMLASCAGTGALRPAPAAKPAASPPILISPEPAGAAHLDLPCVQTGHGCIALNPEVTEKTLARTICVRGYTATIRPTRNYSDGVKRTLLRQAGLDASHGGEYELDHIVPLGVGGHPRKMSNLMLQPWQGPNSATKKDRLERRLQHLVCNGLITLADAQLCIAEDWQACASRISAIFPRRPKDPLPYTR
ncbi:MAG: hypothetical protein M3O06_02825 [Pseudomonadota bacterium]|nr:hypothetical protein [Pseudomonadota bacterium]